MAAEEKLNRRKYMLNAIKRLAASRKALLVFVGAVLALLVHFIPELEPIRGDALLVVESLIALLAALIAAEDIASAGKPLG